MIYLRKEDDQNGYVGKICVESDLAARKYEAMGYQRCDWEAFLEDWIANDLKMLEQMKPSSQEVFRRGIY
jgi:hypothetical protein